MAEPGSKVQLIMEDLGRMMTTRVLHGAFHPNGEQRVLMLSPQIFAVLRISPAGDEHILCLTNVANRPCHVEVATGELGVDWVYWYDLVAGRGWTADGGKLRLRLQPFEVLWLTPFTELERTIESAF